MTRYVQSSRVWIQATIPSRDSHAMVYSKQQNRMLLFGGIGEDGLLDDIWERKETHWRQLEVKGPTARSNHAMVYDGKRNKIVLFGGSDEEGKLGDTWEWDGITTTWIRVATTGPDPREKHAMAYDSKRNRVVLFGGQGINSHQMEDTWEWDGANWMQAEDSLDVPSVRSNHAMAYYPEIERTVLVGREPGSRNEFWTWDGENWLQIEGVETSIEDHSLVYDSQRHLPCTLWKLF